MNIHIGDAYWLKATEPIEVGSGVLHPHVVVQTDTAGDSTVNVCALTTNLRKASMPGNVLLEAGEANLPRASVVEVGKVRTVEVSRLGEYIGKVSEERVRQIQAGIRFVERLRRRPEE